MPQNIIFNSLKESFLLIWKNKLLFVFLVILQIGFFIGFSLISYNYVPKMIESQKSIEEYISTLKLDEASVTSNLLEQKSILGEDPLLISRNFNEIVKNFRLYLINIFILLVLFISINWALTIRIIHKINSKKLINVFLKNFIVVFFYLGLIFVFFFSLLNISLTGVAEESTKLLTKYVPFFVFSIILVYFMFVSISLLYKTELKNIIQKTLVIGIKKIHYILSIYFINIFLFVISSILLYYFIERNLFVLFLSILLMIFSLVFGRIFIVRVVEKIDNL